MEKLEVLRPVGLLEHYHFARCELGIDSSVVASARYSSIQGCGAPSDAHLRYALAEVIHKHPALGVQLIVPSSGIPTFVRLRCIDLSHVIEYSAPGVDIQQALQDQLARPFQVACEQPLWRVTVLPDGYILCAYHHSIADGQSGVSIHMAFLKALNSLSEPLPQEPPTIVDLLPTAAFLPPLEQLTDTSISLRKLCSEVFDVLAPQSWKSAHNSWTGNPVVKDPSVITNIRLWQLSPPDAARLLKICREHGCTLTAFIYTLSAEAFSRVLAIHIPEALERYTSLSTGIAVSLRRYTGTPLETICDQASKAHYYVPITRPSPETIPSNDLGAFPPFPFSKAADFSRKLHHELGQVRQEIGAMWFLFGHFREYFQGMLGRKREGTFTVSNIGRFPSSSDQGGNGRWTVGEMFFAQCDATCGTAIKLNVVGGGDGSVGATFTWGLGALDDELAEAFIQVVKDWTKDVLSS